MATTCRLLFSRSSQHRIKFRPMRPNPLIATLITASYPLVFNHLSAKNDPHYHIVTRLQFEVSRNEVGCEWRFAPSLLGDTRPIVLWFAAGWYGHRGPGSNDPAAESPVIEPQPEAGA